MSRYPLQQHGDLIRWLKAIPNRYVHFGDLDLAGVAIYQNEYYCHLGERSSFLIPDDYEERISKGKRERYDDQLPQYGKMKIADPRVEQLVSCIHRYHRGYDQEGYMEYKTKHRILFVCHGNICRSPMAEFVMKDLVKKVGLEDSFMIESAATSTEEIGNSVYPPARRKLAEHGIGCAGKTARQMTRSDYDRYDLLIGMDSWNIRNMRNICGGDPEGKIVMLMDFTKRPGDVADPWYTGNFEATWRDVLEGCQALLDRLGEK